MRCFLLLCLGMSLLNLNVAKAQVSRAVLPGLKIPEEISPVRTAEISVDAQHSVDIVMRTPPGDGSFPAIVVIHGGVAYRPLKIRITQALEGAMCTRLLAAGFSVVVASYRTYEPHDTENRGPIDDLTAILEHVRSLPQIDPGSVVVLGHSGGGRLVIELAGLPGNKAPTAVIASEPATTLIADLYPVGPTKPDIDVSINYEKYHREKNQKILEERVQRISRPVLHSHSEHHPINRVTRELLIPAMKKYNKLTDEKYYPGYYHGYIWGKQGIPEDLFGRVVSDIVAFSSRYIAVRPNAFSY
jgi:acetyl esterase/lipase